MLPRFLVSYLIPEMDRYINQLQQQSNEVQLRPGLACSLIISLSLNQWGYCTEEDVHLSANYRFPLIKYTPMPSERDP